MEKERRLELASSSLHILAMLLMLCDHLWATLFPAAEWLTCLGRIAFPIFAFLLVEGFFHTRDLRRYAGRLLLWAVISEAPFNWMYGGGAFYPFHQNVLWTLLLSLGCIWLMEKARPWKPLLRWIVRAGVILAGYVLGYAFMVDYYGVGVLTVITFYIYHGRNGACFLGQLICLYLLHVQLLGGYCMTFTLFGHELELVQQGLALLALLPIWLYRGEKGRQGRGFRLFCYGFYPAHMLVLMCVREWMLR